MKGGLRFSPFKFVFFRDRVQRAMSDNKVIIYLEGGEGGLVRSPGLTPRDIDF